MKLAVASICYNESEYIGACIRNWEGLVDKHLVLISSKPWNGVKFPDDGTVDISRKLGAEVVIGEWETEAQQRNEGIAILYDYDYVLIVDPDELYTKETQKKLLDMLSNPIDRSWRTDKKVQAFCIENMITYWKTPEYVLEPRDSHKPIIAVDPKQLYCHEHRQFGADYIPVVPGECHHFSWVKSDEKVKEKIQSYSHSDAIKPDWYNEVWKKWTPGSNMNVRPYGKPSVATRKKCPDEILSLLEKS
jgi:glycosyltransferase involved in cell wall biosynthesis